MLNEKQQKELEELQEMMEGTGRMAAAVIAEILESPRMANSMATFSRNYYGALVEKGFTKEEAFQIMIHAPIGSLFQGPK